MSLHPRKVLVFSGKRKSGKDYVTEMIQKMLGSNVCAILRLSAPLKEQYAKEHNLDYARLLNASEYKERYRSDMIRWGEEKRRQDPGYFCRLICQGPGSECPVWIISDARRQTDLQYFLEHYSEQLITVRVQASEQTRRERGWVFTQGIDDAESECGLDTGNEWDFMVQNDGDSQLLDTTVTNIIECIKKR